MVTAPNNIPLTQDIWLLFTVWVGMNEVQTMPQGLSAAWDTVTSALVSGKYTAVYHISNINVIAWYCWSIFACQKLWPNHVSLGVSSANQCFDRWGSLWCHGPAGWAWTGSVCGGLAAGDSAGSFDYICCSWVLDGAQAARGRVSGEGQGKCFT